MKRIKELDGLRTVAIFSVFLLHFAAGHLSTSFGWAGVDLFFVISGFLITEILLKLRDAEHPYQTFYWRRLIRIFPPYYTVLFAIGVLIMLRGERFDSVWWPRAVFFLPELKTGISFHLIFERLAGHAPFDLGHKLIVGFGPSGASLAVPAIGSGIFVYWSLCVEELFYLFWAPVVLTCSRRIVWRLAVAALVVCPVLRALTHVADFNEYFGFFTRFDALAAGACVALLFQSGAKISKWALLLIPCCIVALLGLSVRVGFLQGVDPRSTELFSAFGYSLFALMFACIVAASVQWRGHPLLAVLRSAPIVYLGTISYTMYLIHLTVYALVFPHLPGAAARGITAVLVTISLSALSWRYFESPILRLRNWWYPADAKPPQTVAICTPAKKLAT